MVQQYSTTPRVDVARSTLLDSLAEKFTRSAAAFQDVSYFGNSERCLNGEGVG